MDKKKRPIDVFVTRDSGESDMLVFPATVGIRKFHGCIEWGAAWSSFSVTEHLYPRRMGRAKWLDEEQCRCRFGFYPRAATAYLIEYNAKGQMKKSKVDIDFSD